MQVNYFVIGVIICTQSVVLGKLQKDVDYRICSNDSTKVQLFFFT